MLWLLQRRWIWIRAIFPIGPFPEPLYSLSDPWSKPQPCHISGAKSCCRTNNAGQQWRSKYEQPPLQCGISIHNPVLTPLKTWCEPQFFSTNVL